MYIYERKREIEIERGKTKQRQREILSRNWVSSRKKNWALARWGLSLTWAPFGFCAMDMYYL